MLTAEELGSMNHRDVEVLGTNFKFISKLKCVSRENVDMENKVNFFKWHGKSGEILDRPNQCFN